MINRILEISVILIITAPETAFKFILQASKGGFMGEDREKEKGRLLGMDFGSVWWEQGKNG